MTELFPGSVYLVEMTDVTYSSVSSLIMYNNVFRLYLHILYPHWNCGQFSSVPWRSCSSRRMNTLSQDLPLQRNIFHHATPKIPYIFGAKDVHLSFWCYHGYTRLMEDNKNVTQPWRHTSDAIYPVSICHGLWFLTIFCNPGDTMSICVHPWKTQVQGRCWHWSLCSSSSHTNRGTLNKSAMILN